MSDTPVALQAASPNTQPPPPLAEPAILDVINATSRDGLAGAIEEAFAGRGFTRGSATTAAVPADDSTIEYGPGADRAAQVLADQLHVPATANDDRGRRDGAPDRGNAVSRRRLPSPPRRNDSTRPGPGRSVPWPPRARATVPRRRPTSAR